MKIYTTCFVFSLFLHTLVVAFVFSSPPPSVVVPKKLTTIIEVNLKESVFTTKQMVAVLPTKVSKPIRPSSVNSGRAGGRQTHSVTKPHTFTSHRKTVFYQQKQFAQLNAESLQSDITAIAEKVAFTTKEPRVNANEYRRYIEQCRNTLQKAGDNLNTVSKNGSATIRLTVGSNGKIIEKNIDATDEGDAKNSAEELVRHIGYFAPFPKGLNRETVQITVQYIEQVE
jgi:hypothetical protein